MNLKIKPIKTQKDLIKQPVLAQHGIIPKLGSSILLVGKSGSGKSTLLANLIGDSRFYASKKSFDHIFLFSPTGEADDVQKQIGIPASCVFTDLTKDGIPALQKIHKYQEEEVKSKGAAKAKQICIIFDDIIGNIKFMNEPCFTKCFIACRHINATVFLCSQHFTRVPRVCRLQASYLAFFAISNSEAELLAEEFAPPSLHKKGFLAMIDETLNEPYSFLGINMKEPWEKRFRKNLDEVISLDYYRLHYNKT